MIYRNPNFRKEIWDMKYTEVVQAILQRHEDQVIEIRKLRTLVTYSFVFSFLTLACLVGMIVIYG